MAGKDKETPPSPTLDIAAPVLSKLGVKPLRRALRLRFTLSEDATVRIVVKRKGAGRRVVKTVKVRAGARAVKLRVGRLRTGRYTVKLVATDAAGSTGKARTLRFRRR